MRKLEVQRLSSSSRCVQTCDIVVLLDMIIYAGLERNGPRFVTSVVLVYFMRLMMRWGPCPSYIIVVFIRIENPVNKTQSKVHHPPPGSEVQPLPPEACPLSNPTMHVTDIGK